MMSDIEIICRMTQSLISISSITWWAKKRLVLNILEIKKTNVVTQYYSLVVFLFRLEAISLWFESRG